MRRRPEAASSKNSFYSASPTFVGIIVVFVVTLFVTVIVILLMNLGKREKLLTDQGQRQTPEYLIFSPFPKNVLLDTDTTPPTTQKTIWILWFQGWHEAPWLARAVATSWAKHNTGWTIRLVSDHNLRELLPDTQYLWNVQMPAARSDVVRLNLLEKHGGVWADASMICFMPLDTWVCDALRPVGFWMYHGGVNGLGPASWFIISTKESYLIRMWKMKCDAYWTDGGSNRTTAHDYFWMDSLFHELLASDAEFRDEWQSVPYLYCEDYGQSHMFAGRVMQRDLDLIDVVYRRPPYAAKLSLHGVPEFTKVNGTNLYAAVDSALRPCWLMSNPNSLFGIQHNLKPSRAPDRPDVIERLSREMRCNT